MSDLSKMSNDELLLLANGHQDNLARQKTRSGGGVDKYDVKNLANEDLYAALGQAPPSEAKPAAAKQAPAADAISMEELYALGSSPETLAARLKAQPQPKATGPDFDHGIQLTNPERWKRGFGSWQGFKDEVADEAKRGANAIGNMATRALDSATIHGYSNLRDGIGNVAADVAYLAGAPRVSGAISNAVKGNAENERRFAAEEPFLASTASDVGYLAGAPKAAGAIAEAGAGALGRALPRVLGNPVVQGALSGGGTAAIVNTGEATERGGNLRDIGSAAGRGFMWGGAIGGGLSAAQAGLGRLSDKSSETERRLTLSDLSEGAPASKRDRMVGKAGEKADRIVSLADRTPDLKEARGNPETQKPIIEGELDRTGGALDEVYRGAKVPLQVYTRPLREVAAEIRAKHPTGDEAAVAARLESEADAFDAQHAPPKPPAAKPSPLVDAYGQAFPTPELPPPAPPAPIDARAARRTITAFGKGLFTNNPNNPVAIPRQYRQQVYVKQVNALGEAVEALKPGIKEELQGLNAEHSDWLNMLDAVNSRAARAQTPSMTLHSRGHQMIDSVLQVMRPGHYLAKKGIERFGPNIARGALSELTTAGQGSLLSGANPLLRALEAEKVRNQQRAEAVRRNEGVTKQLQAEAEDEQRKQQMQALIEQLNSANAQN